MAFCEALVDRFYDGVQDDPALFARIRSRRIWDPRAQADVFRRIWEADDLSR